MHYKLFTFLKKKRLSDPFQINSLVVSAFIQERGWKVEHCSIIRSLLGYEQGTVSEFISVLDENGYSFLLEDLIELFEFVVSPADRIVTGAIYTPSWIRNNILEYCLGELDANVLQRIRIADISCGCGGFLMDAAWRIHKITGKSYASIFRDSIYGIDIQEYSIERTKILLSLLALSEGEDAEFSFNLLCRDTLDYLSSDWDEGYRDFDVVVGNPPYVRARNLSDEEHTKMKRYEVCESGNPDLYIPFFQIAIEMLNNSGRLGYITMNTFLRSVNGRAIREYLSRNRLAIRIVDHRGFQVFESKNTYTCLFFVDKHEPSDSLLYAVNEMGDDSGDLRFSAFLFANLDNERGWALNDFETTAAFETAGVQIKDYCPSRHGIATLSNDIYIFRPAEEDDRYYYLDNKKGRFPIEKEICRNIVNPNKLNSVEDLNGLFEKVIYPYRVNEGQAVIYTPEEMQSSFPMAYAYLETHRDVLSMRDKGKTKDYRQWFSYGRTQSLVMPRYKLFFPKFANKPLKCIICDAPDLMLYNGLAFVSNDERKLKILKSIIESELFWYYVRTNGKPYASGYYSLSGVDIKYFGIPEFSKEEEDELLALREKDEIERWLRKYYLIKENNSEIQG